MMYRALICGLCLHATSDEDFTIREWGERALRTRASAQAGWSITDPESAARVTRVRRVAIVRDLDALAAAYGGYPPDWRCTFRVLYHDVRWPTDTCSERDPCWPPEFWVTDGHWMEDTDASGWRTWIAPTDEERVARTRHALTAYVCRTGDWRTAHRIIMRTSR